VRDKRRQISGLLKNQGLLVGSIGNSYFDVLDVLCVGSQNRFETKPLKINRLGPVRMGCGYKNELVIFPTRKQLALKARIQWCCAANGAQHQAHTQNNQFKA
jgi:hypothetical protein